MRALLAALLSLAAIAAACGNRSASAPLGKLEGEPIAKAMPVAGPVLHGDSVAWGEGGIEDGDGTGPIRVMVASPGRATRLVYESRPSKGRPEWWFGDFAASPRKISLVRSWSNCEPAPYDQCVDETDIAVGTPAEDFRLLPRHDKGCEYVPASHHVDLDGDRIVFSGAFCAPGCGPCARIAVDDLTDATPPRILAAKPQAVDDIRVAGSFIAARSVSWEQVAVYELPSGKLVYKVRLPAHSTIDLQPDGKLVAAWFHREGAKAAWFSPDEPAKHIIPISPVLIHSYEEHVLQIAVRLVNDHVAFERQVTPEKSELVVADLNGKVVRRVASFDEKRARVGDFDFDGKRATWATMEVRDVKKHCWRISEAGHMACKEQYVGPTTIYVARLP